MELINITYPTHHLLILLLNHPFLLIVRNALDSRRSLERSITTSDVAFDCHQVEQVTTMGLRLFDYVESRVGLS